MKLANGAGQAADFFVPYRDLVDRLKSFVQGQAALAKAVVIPGVRYVPGVVPVVVFIVGAAAWGAAEFVLLSIAGSSRANADMWFAGQMIAGVLFLVGLPLIVAS